MVQIERNIEDNKFFLKLTKSGILSSYTISETKHKYMRISCLGLNTVNLVTKRVLMGWLV